MAPMAVPQNYYELLPSGLRSITLVKHHSLRCVVVDDDGMVVFDHVAQSWWPPWSVEFLFETMRRV